MADSSRMASIAIWILIVLTAFAFAAAGVLKLVGDPMFSDSFGKIGLPGAFGYFIGCCEIAGAVGLFIRRLATLAAAGLAIIMLGAQALSQSRAICRRSASPQKSLIFRYLSATCIPEAILS